MWITLYFLLTNKNFGAISVVILLFMFVLSYFISGFYFIRLSGYVGNDVALRLSSWYQEHQNKIKKGMKVVGIILLVVLAGLLVFYLPAWLPTNGIGSNLSTMITSIFATIVAGVFLFRMNKNRSSEK